MTGQCIPVFLDTDIGPDCDDVGALAILNLLCDRGSARLIGATHCTGSPYGLSAISAVNTAFGRAVPMGTCQDKTFLADGPALCYTPTIASTFAHRCPPEAPQRSAVEALCEALEAQVDASVTLTAIGPQNNLAAFLRDGTAGALIARKVRRLVLMAGRFEGEGAQQAEWNIEQDAEAARLVALRWPGEVIYCPFETGESVLTGGCLTEYGQNPVALAYRLFTRGGMLRPSWDLIAVYYAVLGESGLWSLSEPGVVTVGKNGVTRFEPQAGGKHRYLRNLAVPEKVERALEALLCAACATMERRTCQAK